MGETSRTGSYVAFGTQVRQGDGDQGVRPQAGAGQSANARVRTRGTRILSVRRREIRSDEERDNLLVTRLRRARILDDFRPPEACALSDETDLRRHIGGPAVVCAQLRHIVESGQSRRIRVHVLSFSSGAQALPCRRPLHIPQVRPDM
ncbi:Scr1 family TA system antitoxin-like transcriptional regulator [Streptomyces sp. NPDC020898]|uniref:Scr1 family TA system antitoxin-like transcriptional regulator n=1 Tax=Streptomyces sp. NPDC020898 TaxID=3365101 RepID=UPI00378D0BF9